MLTCIPDTNSYSFCDSAKKESEGGRWGEMSSSLFLSFVHSLPHLFFAYRFVEHLWDIPSLIQPWKDTHLSYSSNPYEGWYQKVHSSVFADFFFTCVSLGNPFISSQSISSQEMEDKNNKDLLYGENQVPHEWDLWQMSATQQHVRSTISTCVSLCLFFVFVFWLFFFFHSRD